MTPKKIRMPLAQQLQRARVGLLPFVVWLLCIWGATRLWAAGVQTGQYLGIAHVSEQEVSMPIAGMLVSLQVELHQEVQKGQVLAVLHGADLEAELETARAELQRLRAEFEAQRADLGAREKEAKHEFGWRRELALSVASLEYPAELRAFHSDEANLNLGLSEVSLELTSSHLEADRIEIQLTRGRALAKERLTPESSLEDLEKLHGLALARSRELVGIENSLKRQLEEARLRREQVLQNYVVPSLPAFPESSIEARLAGWKAAMEVQGKRLKQLALLREKLWIRAPTKGTVSRLDVFEGQYLGVGEAILTIVRPNVDGIDVWVLESSPSFPQPGDNFIINGRASASASGFLECSVQSVGPYFEAVPKRFWRDPKIPEYGRVCLLGPVSKQNFVPGQLVGVTPLED